MENLLVLVIVKLAIMMILLTQCNVQPATILALNVVQEVFSAVHLVLQAQP